MQKKERDGNTNRKIILLLAQLEKYEQEALESKYVIADAQDLEVTWEQ